MRSVLVPTILLFVSFSGFSQCPEKETISIRLDAISRKTNNIELIADLNALVRLCRKCNYTNDSTYAKTLHILGRTLWWENRLDSAVLLTKLAILANSQKSQSTNYANLCHSYFNLGCIYNDLGNMKLAVGMIKQAVRIGSKFPDKKASVAESYNKLAGINFSIGDYENTILYAEKGYELGNELKNNDIMARSLMEKSQALIELKNKSESEILLSKASKLVSNSEKESLKGAIYSLTAAMKAERGEANDAIYFYKKAYESSLRSGYEFGCGETATNLGAFYAKYLSDYNKALKYYHIALKHMTQPWAKAAVFNSIAEAWIGQGNLINALTYSQKSIQSVLPGFKNSDPNYLPGSNDLKNIVDKTALLGIIQTKADTWLKIAHTKRQNKTELQNALHTYMLADTLVDYMRWEHSGAVSKLFWRDKTRSLYENAIEASYLSKDIEKAFYFFEKSRAVLLNDQLNELAANKMLAPEDFKKEFDLQQKVTDVQIELAENDTPALRESMFKAQTEKDAFVKGLEQKNPRYYAYKYDNHVPVLKEFVQKELDENQFFLSYFIGDSAVYSMLISKNGNSIRKINLNEYQKAVTDFQNLIVDQEAQNQHFYQYLASASELYRLLIKPLSIPQEARIIVSPDGDFLPYGALSKSSSIAQYLIYDYAFSYSYSARSLTKSLKRTEPLFPSNTFLGLAPVKFNQRLAQAPLPGSEQALAIINDHFSFPKLLTGEHATRKNFLAAAPSYRIVQVLTHATGGSKDTAPTLYFADSTIKLSELTAIRNAQTELMVLSACETGIGKVQHGEGVFSLARGFAALGIPSAVTTLWSLENQAVYQLTQSFYDGLDDQDDLDIAIQKAQLKWLDSVSKGKQLPYYWAGMVVVGSTEPIKTGKSLIVLYIFLGLVVISILIYLAYRRSPNAGNDVKKFPAHI